MQRVTTPRENYDVEVGCTSGVLYVYNNPVNLVDPTGEVAWALPAAVGTGVVLSVCYATNSCEKLGDALGDALDAWWSLPKPSDFMPSPPWVNNDDGEAEPESCPSTDPDDWEKIRGSDQAYRPKGRKEPIFEADRGGDRSHAESKWKKWDKKRDWKKRQGPREGRSGTYDGNGNRLRD